MKQVTRAGVPVDVAGDFPAVGQAAQPLTLTNVEMADVTLADYAGKRKVLNIIPSIDTPTCATSTFCTPGISRNLFSTTCDSSSGQITCTFGPASTV